jgi:mRNA deadenylase 3'-5' endonuclease subunit Ccr4
MFVEHHTLRGRHLLTGGKQVKKQKEKEKTFFISSLNIKDRMIELVFLFLFEKLFSPLLLPTTPMADKSFSVLTYNILNPNFVKKEWFPKCSPEVLDFDSRIAKVVGELENFSADAMCLQEVSAIAFETLFNWFGWQYYCIYQGKTDTTRKPASDDGVAIFLKKEKFLGPTIEGVKKVSVDDLVIRVSDDPLYQRGTVALFRRATLRSDPSKKVVIGNVHIDSEWKWNDFQALQMVQTLKALTAFAGNDAWILCGDFNSRPDTASYKLMLEGKVEKQDWLNNKDQDTSRVHFYDSHPHELEHPHAHEIKSAYREIYDHEPRWTNCTSSFNSCLDYQFFRFPALAVKEIINSHNLLFTEEETVKLQRDGGLPNAKCPSDHLPIVVQYVFQE